MLNRLTLGIVALTVLVGVGQVEAVVFLEFEGLADFEAVGDYYGGGTGGWGSGPGENYGVTFSPSAVAAVNSDGWGGAPVWGMPSPNTALYFLPISSSHGVMNHPTGFDTGFSLFYSAPFSPGTIKVYDGLDGAGNVLATLDLPANTSPPFRPSEPYSPFLEAGVGFTGTAKSVAFSTGWGAPAYDNITLGRADPAMNPEPASLVIWALLGAIGIAVAWYRFRAASRTSEKAL